MITGTLFAFPGRIDSHRDIAGLSTQRVDDSAFRGVKTYFVIVVADLSDHGAYEAVDIDDCVRANFTSNDHDAGFDQRFAGNAGLGILFQHGIEHCI